MIAGEADDIRADSLQGGHIFGFGAEVEIVRVDIGHTAGHKGHLIADVGDVGAGQLGANHGGWPGRAALVHLFGSLPAHGRDPGHGNHGQQVGVTIAGGKAR